MHAAAGHTDKVVLKLNTIVDLQTASEINALLAKSTG
jgi:hypothetical protein